MVLKMDKLREEIRQIRDDLCLLKHIVSEDEALSAKTRKDLEAARDTPLSKYIRHETVKSLLLK